MSSIIHGIFEIFQGVADAIVGIFTTLFQAVFSAVQGAINIVWQAFAVALNAVYHIFATAGDIAKHAGSFVLANIIPIAVVVALLVAWSAMQARSGGKVAGKKRA